MTQNTVQIGFRGTREYRAQLQRAALNHGKKVQTLVRDAVDIYLKSVLPLGEDLPQRGRRLDLTSSTKTIPISNPSTTDPEAFRTLSRGERKWMGKLLKILQSGNKDAIKAVTLNLDAFADYAGVGGEADENRADPPAAKDKPKRTGDSS